MNTARDLTARRQVAAIEGPTRRQIAKAKERWTLAQAVAGLAWMVGALDLSLDLAERAFDIETEFSPYGVRFSR